jgi:hypothetical protein
LRPRRQRSGPRYGTNAGHNWSCSAIAASIANVRYPMPCGVASVNRQSAMKCRIFSATIADPSRTAPNIGESITTSTPPGVNM